MNIYQCTVFMHDGAACHCSKAVKQLLAEKSLATLDRLENTPYLNPIENLWKIINSKVAENNL